MFLSSLTEEMNVAWTGVHDAFGSGHLVLLIGAILTALTFEFINGFHDTANAVATVIYTRSMKPNWAVLLSCICNFLGVFIGGTAVAMGIVKLLPANLLAAHQASVSLAMIFALLTSAILWNLGTWYLGLPASSSHTLIGAILGLGLAHSLRQGIPLSTGVNWDKAKEIGLSLLLSPLVGFVLAGLLLLASKRLLRSPRFHSAPTENSPPPPWPIRGLLILTSTGVSLAHGSNDGQKGVGLIMMILIAVMPAQFALKSGIHSRSLVDASGAARRISVRLAEAAAPAPLLLASSSIDAGSPGAVAASPPVAAKSLQEASDRFASISRELDGRWVTGRAQASQDPLTLRSALLNADKSLSTARKSFSGAFNAESWSAIEQDRATLKGIVEYSPSWVIAAVAIALGLGTLVGWKRIVVTVGEKIGKSQLTYAQGASAGVVAASTIGLSALAGLPVSTTHILSSGIAGTMVAGHSGLQFGTIRNIGLAWLLTLPASMALSAALYTVFMAFVS